MAWPLYGSHRIIWDKRFSFSHLHHVGLELKLSGLAANHLYPRSYLPGSLRIYKKILLLKQK